MVYYQPSNQTTRRSRVVGRARAIGNRVGINWSQEFESLLLRQQKSPQPGAFLLASKEIRKGGSERSSRKKHSPGDCFLPTCACRRTAVRRANLFGSSSLDGSLSRSRKMIQGDMRRVLLSYACRRTAVRRANLFFKASKKRLSRQDVIKSRYIYPLSLSPLNYSSFQSIMIL